MNNKIKINDQLWELSTEQAQKVLDAFLIAERDSFPALKIGSVNLNYSSDSVTQAAHYIASEIKAGCLDKEQQNLWFMRLGYYFGESLCRAKPTLAWSLGNPEYAFANHPVIIGFSNGEEAPIITICKNMIEAVAEGLSPSMRINNGVDAWFDTPIAELR